MKKLVIASAVAAVMASGTAMADTSFGGHIRLLLQNQGSMGLNSNKLTLDVKASEDLGNGMTGIARLELESDSADNEEAGLHNDLSYVGLKGDFGQLTLGVQDDAAGFACGGTDIFTSNSGNACGVGSVNGPLDNAVVYVKGFGEVTLVLGATFDGDAGDVTRDTVATQPATGNHTVVAVQYAADMFSVGLQVTSPDSDLGLDDWTVFGATVKLGEGTLGLTVGDDGTDNAMAIAYSMPLAGGTVKIGVDQGDALANAAGDDTVTNLEFDKNLGKATYYGVQFSDDQRQNDSLVQAILGYKF